MNFKRAALAVLITLTPLISFGQITGFTDTFSDGSLDTLWNGSTQTLWTSGNEDTYSLSETSGVLQIAYNRSSSSGAEDNFTFTPPEPIDIKENPRISFRLRSTVNTTLTIRAAFIPIFGLQEFFVESVSGDNTWKNYTFEIDPDSYDGNPLEYINFYLDRNTSSSRFGTIEIDDLKVSGFFLEVKELTANIIDGTDVELSWRSTDPDGTLAYSIYRDTNPDFEAGTDNIVTGTSDTTYTDLDLTPFTHYYYKVIPIDTLGESYLPSDEISVETYDASLIPEVTVSSVNTTTPGQYEKFALTLGLTNVGIANPYDPDDIDVYAEFISPTDDTTRINGFYDDYNNADSWRVYFSTPVTGTWEYQVFVNDAGGSGESTKGTFTVTESDLTGPLKVSDANPNYLEYNDGTPFYGLSVYYPWDVRETGLNRLEQYGLNMIGYWNGVYDNAGNQGGQRLFESIQSGLGRYDQLKAGRIEQILGWLEARNMKLMYAIWAHPFLRDGAPGWDPIHFEPYNPYKEIVSARDFFTDSLAWEYQKKQYRYLIARFAHHRSLGIWEIINEMHGTTGNYYDENGAREWVNKVHDYLKEHDPYQRPTTASFGSVEVWRQQDIKADIANRHYYETQGYPRTYNDDVHDGLHNAITAYQGLKQSGERPAMFGEAGYTSMFSEPSSFNYTQEYHNAYWGGLATGMASTPFWWDYTTVSLFTDIRMEVYQKLAAFEEELNLSHSNYARSSFDQDGAHIYMNKLDTAAFAWLWKFASENISGTEFTIDDLTNGTYQVTLYDTWEGTNAAVDTLISLDGKLPVHIHPENIVRRDIAVRAQKIENGSTAISIQLRLKENNIVLLPDSSYTIYAIITDESGRLVGSASDEVTLQLTGNGRLSTNTVSAEGGIATFSYTPDENGSTFSITASAPGLESAALNEILVTGNETDPVIEDKPSSFKLHQNYPNPFNPSTQISFDLKTAGHVTLEVFDITGRKISTLFDGTKPSGTHTVQFDAGSLSSGIYLYRLTTNSFTQTRRMVLMK